MTTSKKSHDELLSLEITVLSADSLKSHSSSLFSARLRPYATLSPTTNLAEGHPIYRTRVDDHGAGNPTWGDTVRLPVGPSFVRGTDESAVHVSVLTKRSLLAPRELGWCRIAPSDILDGLLPPAMPRRLSYSLRRGRYGWRGQGQGVVHLVARLVGPHLDRPETSPAPADFQTDPGWLRVAIGIPVAAPVHAMGCMTHGSRSGPKLDRSETSSARTWKAGAYPENSQKH